MIAFAGERVHATASDVLLPGRLRPAAARGGTGGDEPRQ